MKKTLLFFLLRTGPVVFAQINPQKLAAGVEENTPPAAQQLSLREVSDPAFRQAGLSLLQS